MESKYYTPTIDEFHVGFECESNYVLFNRGDYPESMKFVPIILTEENIDWMIDSYIHDAYPSEFRVKCLDKEDIESLGWDIGQSIYHKDKYKLLPSIQDPNHIRIWTEESNVGYSDIIFDGIIKNKSELAVLLKQLGING
jgi:hypothetical protein